MNNKQLDKAGVTGKYRFKTYDSDSGELLRKSEWVDNLVVAGTNHGLGLFMQNLIGISTYPLEITHAKIGTGTTATANGDTDLETITFGPILRATQQFTATSATIEFFISNNELPNGTYTEFGLFCDQQLFARSIISPSYSKSTNEDTGIEYIITSTNV
jgi:hypothetical protein